MTAAQIGLGYLLIVAVVAAAFVLGYLVGDWQPTCPTEDSCRPVYSDGRWEIEQVIP